MATDEATPSPQPSPAPFSDEQLSSLQALITAALASQGDAGAGSGGNGTAPAQPGGPTGQTEGPPVVTGPLGNQPPPAEDGSGPASRDRSGQPDEEEPNEDPDQEELEDDYEPEDDPAGSGLEAFSKEWHRYNQGRIIAPRFVIPARFSPLLPVGFKPETVEHYQVFGTGNVSVGRAEEAANLYNTAAYTTVINNTLHEALADLYSLVNIFESLSPNVQTEISQALQKISDAQVAVYGTYELAASRYEVLCGRQGAPGVADPELLSAYIDPPAAYSSVGRQAFTHQRKWAIKQAAHQAGRRSVKSRGVPGQSQPRSGAPQGGGRGRKTPRNQSVGGGKGRDGGRKGGN